jgi:hypothetical protein
VVVASNAKGIGQSVVERALRSGAAVARWDMVEVTTFKGKLLRWHAIERAREALHHYSGEHNEITASNSGRIGLPPRNGSRESRKFPH